MKLTTLLGSSTALAYGPVTPNNNSAGKYYFFGRSDNFTPGASTNPNNGRLDPEGIRVSNDGKSVFVSDEDGPYVYQFDRLTGTRTQSFTLPDALSASQLSSQGATEIAGNGTGRVANKGMEGLAITPDGKTLVGFMQSPLAQDGSDAGDAARLNSREQKTSFRLQEQQERGVFLPLSQPPVAETKSSKSVSRRGRAYSGQRHLGKFTLSNLQDHTFTRGKMQVFI